MTHEKMIQLTINTIRTLSMDAVQQAKSGPRSVQQVTPESAFG